MDAHRGVGYGPFEGSCRVGMGEGNRERQAGGSVVTALVEKRLAGEVVRCPRWQPLATWVGVFENWLVQSKTCCNYNVCTGWSSQKKNNNDLLIIFILITLHV